MMSTKLPPVLTFLYPVKLTPSLRKRLDSAAPGIEVQAVPYVEETALRSARSRGNLTADQLASAPKLSDGDWALLDRTTVVVALDLPTGMLERSQSLEWVQSIGAGTEHLDSSGLARRGVIFTNAAGVTADSISEFVLGRLLQVWKYLRTLDRRQSDRRWEPQFGRRVAGLTLGVVGLGAIGRATAKRARAFEMQVVGNRRRAAPGDRDPDVDRLYTADQIDEMLSVCDAVLISAPASPETEHLFDAERIAAMKPGAVLCNVARGSLVDEDAVVDALNSGHLSAAILDVTEEEPTPSDSPLWTAPNCYLSPHTSVALESLEADLVDLVVRNLGRFVRGEQLENVVSDWR
jgi:phosphoglycerate dehydrogenase-like enzyme